MIGLLALALLGSSADEQAVEFNMVEETEPQTLSDVVAELMAVWDVSDKESFAETPYHDLVQFHFSLGGSVRSQYGLWNPETPLHQWFYARGATHPDGMSAHILRVFWFVLNDCEIAVEEPYGDWVEGAVAEARLRGDDNLPVPLLPAPQDICPSSVPIGEPPEIPPLIDLEPRVREPLNP